MEEKERREGKNRWEGGEGKVGGRREARERQGKGGTGWKEREGGKAGKKEGNGDKE